MRSLGVGLGVNWAVSSCMFCSYTLTLDLVALSGMGYVWWVFICIVVDNHVWFS